MKLLSLLRAQIAAGALALLTMAGALFAWDALAPHSLGAAPAATSSVVGRILPSADPAEDPRAGTPVRLIIPRIGVDASVERVGLLPDGTMDTPATWEDVGWYELGPKPGERGNAVIAGHFDSDTGKAVFYDLHQLQPGDTLRTTDSTGTTRTFMVRRTRTYAAEEAPLDEIFGASGGYHLNLITCDGKWLKAEHRYQSRLAVFTDLVR